MEKIVSIKLNNQMLALDENTKNLNIISWNGDDILLNSHEIKLELCFKGVGDLHFIIEKSKDFQCESIFVWEFDDSIFKKHVNNLKELSELESDKNKWVLVTLIYLMSLRNYKFYETIIENYFILLINEIDETRRQYYVDWRSKIIKNNF